MYLGGLINLAADKFKANGSAAAKLFFTCVDENSTTEYAKWLRGLKKNVTREVVKRASTEGDVIDN